MENKRRSLDILERSCFGTSGEDCEDEDEVQWKCFDCDLDFANRTKFAKHAYAHTFVR